jgi:nucleoside-diphosphate-sugar epimerase
MPTLALEAGATVFVTGVNGLIGSHITDQLLKMGYNVRGAVRNAEKHQYLVEYFSEKHKNAQLELVNVPDMTIEGCYDEFMQGGSNFIPFQDK